MPARLPREELLRRLVAFDTTSRRSNRALVDFVSDYLDRPGVRRDTLETDGKIELHLRQGPEEGSAQGLALSGHTDCVPAGEASWLHDPFDLTDGGDRWSGRGSCDMKGFLALAIDLFERRTERRLDRPLHLLFTSDEEIGSLGVRRWAADEERRRSLPRSVVVGEPTELAVIRLHKGHLRGRITFRGVGAHSAFPHRGVNAIASAGKALRALGELQEILRHERRPSSSFFGEVPFEVINPARIRGGEAINVIPEHCDLDFGIRLLPGSDAAGLLERMRGALESLALEAAWEIRVDTTSPPLDTPDDAQVHRLLSRLVGQDTTRAAAFSSDAGVLSEHGFECVLFGPGSIEVAHRPNEYLPKADFERASEVLEHLVDDFCGGTA